MEDRIQSGDLIYVRGELVLGNKDAGWEEADDDDVDEEIEEDAGETAPSPSLPANIPSVVASRDRKEPFLISSGTQADAFDAAAHAVKSALVAAGLGIAGVSVLLWLRFAA